MCIDILMFKVRYFVTHRYKYNKKSALTLLKEKPGLVRRRQMQNAVSCFGHFLSWATEFFVIGIVVTIVFFIDKSRIDVDVGELYTFLYPCINLVIFPFVQLMSSSVLRKEAQKFFKGTAETQKNAVINCITNQ